MWASPSPLNRSMERPTYTYTDPHGQSIEFVVPEPHTKFIMNISGGADSAIMFWMLVNYCHDHIPDAEIHVITCANVVKGWYNAKWSATVLDKILELTKTEIVKSHYTYFSDDQRRTELNDTEKLIHKIHGTTLTVHGTTQNPPLDIEYLLKGRHEPRDEGHGRPTFTFLSPQVVRWMPIMGVDKRMVAYLYDHFDMREKLLPFTRSCEQESRHNKDEPSWMVSHCGECWWCKEREWAFGNSGNS